MKVLGRVLAVAGVLYLAAVSVLFFVLSHRASEFEKTAPTVQGTVVRLEQKRTTEVRDIFHTRPSQVPVIDYTLNGVKGEFVADNNRSHNYHVGEVVTLVYAANDPETNADDVLMIKGQDLRPLRAVGFGFAIASVLAAWGFGLTSFLNLRRRQRRHSSKESRSPVPVG